MKKQKDDFEKMHEIFFDKVTAIGMAVLLKHLSKDKQIDKIIDEA